MSVASPCVSRGDAKKYSKRPFKNRSLEAILREYRDASQFKNNRVRLIPGGVTRSAPKILGVMNQRCLWQQA